MASTVRIDSGELNEDWLERFPVWTWVDDFYNEDLIEPVPASDPLPDDAGDLFVRAVFRTPSGRRFGGLVIVADEVYVVELYAGGEGFVFNVNMDDDSARQWLDKLRRKLGDEGAEIFPLTYETGFRLHDGSPLSGTFDPFK